MRPYYWGAIYLSDSKEFGDPDFDFTASGPVFFSTTGFAVAVIDGSAVNEEAGNVTLDVWIKKERSAGFPYEGVIELASGRLCVGDAEAEDRISLRAGRWLAQVKVNDLKVTTEVQLALSPLGTA